MANELPTYTENARASLVEIRADNIRFPRLHSYPPEIAVKSMLFCVIKAYSYFGIDANEEAAGNLAIELYNELMADTEGMRTYNLTFEEILRAIKKAAMGNSVEFYGKVSFHFLYKAIMHYVKGEGVTANKQMLRTAEAGRIAAMNKATQLITAAPTRKMLERMKEP